MIDRKIESNLIEQTANGLEELIDDVLREAVDPSDKLDAVKALLDVRQRSLDAVLKYEENDLERKRLALKERELDMQQEELMQKQQQSMLGLASPVLGAITSIVEIVSSRNMLKNAILFEKIDDGGVLPTKFLSRLLK